LKPKLLKESITKLHSKLKMDQFKLLFGQNHGNKVIKLQEFTKISKLKTIVKMIVRKIDQSIFLRFADNL